MTAVIPALPFHDKGPGGEQPFATVSLQLSRSRWSSNDPFPVQHCLREGVAFIHQLEGEIRPFLIQQPEEDFVALPDGHSAG